jgi:hypothetical protein
MQSGAISTGGAANAVAFSFGPAEDLMHHGGIFKNVQYLSSVTGNEPATRFYSDAGGFLSASVAVRTPFMARLRQHH